MLDDTERRCLPDQEEGEQFSLAVPGCLGADTSRKVSILAAGAICAASGRRNSLHWELWEVGQDEKSFRWTGGIKEKVV